MLHDVWGKGVFPVFHVATRYAVQVSDTTQLLKAAKMGL